MAKRTVSVSKQKHEVSKYLLSLQAELIGFAVQVDAAIPPLTIAVIDDGIGEIWCPSRAVYQKMKPDAAPAGLVFHDGSFLIFHEIVRFGYPDKTAMTPKLYRLQYGYHYQRNERHFYFRFDHHPTIGEPETHPLHHLHSAGWLPKERQFQDAPRYEVKEATLAKALRLIFVSFPSIRV